MKQISAALVKAQKAFGPALKSSTNPHFKSKYADLAACVEAVIDGLNANGVFLMQSNHESDTGVTVETVFVHESGEVLSAGKLHVPAAKHDPQGFGSALTYARRYSLMAACGIAPEDDDGNAGTKAIPNRTKVMQVQNSITEHFTQGREMGALQEWELAIEISEDFAKAVWSGLTTPIRDQIRALRDKAYAKEPA
jgi:hypothetical protein